MAGKDETPKAQQFSNISMRCPHRLAQHTCVWFSMKCGDPPAVTLQKILMCFPGVAYSKATVFHWHKAFKDGRTKVGDLYQGGHRTVRSDENIQLCVQTLNKDRKQTITGLAKKTKLTYGSVARILHRDLELTKRSAKLVPHLLSDRDRHLRLEFCQEFVDQYSFDERCIHWVMMTDESWFFQYDPLSNRESKQWLLCKEDHGQIVRREMNVKKVMLIPFFDSHGLVHWEYFKDQTITKEIFLPVLQRVRQSLLSR